MTCVPVLTAVTSITSLVLAGRTRSPGRKRDASSQMIAVAAVGLGLKVGWLIWPVLGSSVSSIHSWTVLMAARLASPRWSSSGVSCGLTMPMMSETSSTSSGRLAPAVKVDFPVNDMGCSFQGVRIG